MDIKNLDQIQTPSHWKNDVLNAQTRIKKPMVPSKLAAIVCIFVLMITFTFTAVAATPHFREWLTAQFESDVQITEFTAYEVTESGFLKKQDRICYLEGNKLIPLSPKTLSGAKWHNGQYHAFRFEYFSNGDKIHVNSKSKNIVSVTAYDDAHAIIWLDLGNLWNSYFINLHTGVLKPIAEEPRTAITDGILKLATDVEVSKNRDYLLYRSNRDTLKTDSAKGEWFIQKLSTGIEIKLDRAPQELFSNEIGFIDETHIAISYNDNHHPMIYNCETNAYTDLEKMDASDFGNSLIYYMDYKDENYIFYDLYKDKIYKIKQKENDRVVVATRDFICLLASDGSANLYLIKQNKTLNFKNDQLAENAVVYDVKALNENIYLFITSEAIYAVNFQP